MVAENAKKERDIAIEEADEVKKERDEYKRKVDKVEREREEARGGNQDQMNKAQKQRPPSGSMTAAINETTPPITKGMEDMNLNSDTEAAESDDNPSTG